MTMPSPRRTVNRTSRLLIRMGYSRIEALETIISATGRGLVRWGGSGVDLLWMIDVQREAMRQLGRQSGRIDPATREGDAPNASTETGQPGPAGPGPA